MTITTLANICGVRILRKRYVDTHTKMGLLPVRCAVCGKDIDDGERYSLITNRCVLFPNVMVHDSHFGTDEENELLIRNIMTKKR